MLEFPRNAITNIPKNINPVRRAKYYERAVAAGILLYASVRIQNLRNIQIGKNLRKIGDAYLLTFDESEMKNRRPLQLPLPHHFTDILEAYIAEYRPLLAGASGSYLFPGRGGGPRPAATMRQDFESAVFKHTGLKVHPHLMLHLIGKLAVDTDSSMVTAVSQR